MSRLAHSCIDNTGGALLQVDFDPRVVTYKQMLDLVWGMHDPYRNKSSRQYRNAIWYAAAARGVRTSRALTPPTHAHTRTVRYHNDEQKKVLLDQVAKMNNPSSGGIHRPVRSHPMPPQPLACRHASRLPVPHQVATAIEPLGAFWLAEDYHQQCTCMHAHTPQVCRVCGLVLTPCVCVWCARCADNAKARGRRR